DVKDLKDYRAKEREPVHGTYRGYDIHSMPPPSSGGVAIVEMLNVLEPMNLRQRDRWSASSLHLTIEAMRRAYLDRARSLGDPDFVKVPVAELTSKRYAAQIAREIDPEHAANSATLAPDLLGTKADESDETTHISVADGTGMAVSLTYTLEGGFGS